MLAVSAGVGEGGDGPTTEVVSVLPAAESGTCGSGEALEGGKCGEGGRNIVGREEWSDLSIRRYGAAMSCPVVGVEAPRVRKSAKGGKTDDGVCWPSLSLNSRSLSEWRDVLAYLSGNRLILLSFCTLELRELGPSSLGGASGLLSNRLSTMLWVVGDM